MHTHMQPNTNMTTSHHKW